MTKFLLTSLMFILMAFSATSSLAIDVSFTHLILRDVQALFGGQNLYVNSNGEVWVQGINRLGEETRIHYAVSKDALTELSHLLEVSQNLDFTIQDNKGGPSADEVFPELIVRLNNKQVHRVFKRHSRVHPLFDPISSYLMNLSSHRVAKDKIIYRGAYLRGWVPNGFEGL